MAKKKADHAPPGHVLVVDTNILWLEDKGPAVNPEFDKFWQEQKAQLPLELVIPEVVTGRTRCAALQFRPKAHDARERQPRQAFEHYKEEASAPVVGPRDTKVCKGKVRAVNK